MPNLCNHCEEEFYSDTEFKEHKNMLAHISFATELAQLQQRSIIHIGNGIRVQTIVEIAKKDNVSYPEAVATYIDMGFLIDAELKRREFI